MAQWSFPCLRRDTPQDRALSAWGFLTTRLCGRWSFLPREATSSPRATRARACRSSATVWKRSASTLLLVLLLHDDQTFVPSRTPGLAVQLAISRGGDVKRSSDDAEEIHGDEDR